MTSLSLPALPLLLESGSRLGICGHRAAVLAEPANNGGFQHLPIASRIVEFSHYGLNWDLSPRQRSRPNESLRALAQVSKSWYKFVLELLVRFDQESMELQFTKSSRSEMLEIRREVQLRGAGVRDLQFTIGEKEKRRYRHEYKQLSNLTESAAVDWNTVLDHLPGLKRLDLTMVPLESRHLPEMIEAAGKYSLQMEVLVLSRKVELKSTIQGSKIERVMVALYIAMERWYSKGNCGGLKQLTVPTRNDGERFRSSTDFIENVTRFCSNVEYLDGCRKVFRGYGSVRCEERRVISLETWEKFVATCTKLREFDWVTVPFADPYFRAFGGYPKLQLRHLDLSANIVWDWDEYFLACDAEPAPSSKFGYGGRAHDVGSVFKGCPALARFCVAMDYRRGHHVMNTFGDDFWGSLATHYPRLEYILIENNSSYDDNSLEFIESFTDAALLRFAELKYLVSTESQVAVMCTGDGIFEHFRRAMQYNHEPRELWSLALAVGGQEYGDSGPPSFYSVLVAFLKRLVAISEKDLRGTRQVELIISNLYRSLVGHMWSATYLRDELKPLLERVKLVHPLLKAKVNVNGYTGTSFHRIEYVVIDSRSGRAREMFSNSEAGDLYHDPSVTDETAPPGFRERNAPAGGGFFDFMDRILGPSSDDVDSDLEV